MPLTSTKTITVTIPDRPSTAVTITRKRLYLDDQSYPPHAYTATTNGSGVATFVLPVPDDEDLAAEYQVAYPGIGAKTVKAKFLLAQGSPDTLEEVLTLALAGTAWSASQQIYVDLDERLTDLEGQAGALPATSSVKGIVRISGTPTDADNPTVYVTEQVTTLLAGKAATTVTDALDTRVDTLEAAPPAHNQAWSTITSTPTTLAGYGITDAASDSELAAHEADTTSVHGIANTALLETTSGAQTKADAAQAAAIQRANHTGTQSADTLTDGTTNKAFTATERTKLAGIATGATANATDAQLRDRSTHTGTQASSTISDFATAADARIAAASVNALSDVTISSPASGQVLKYNGSAWVNDTDATGGGGGVTDGDKGDITVSSSGAAWAIDSDAVTDAKLRDSTALSVIGRSANSTGDPADIAAGSDGQVLRRSGTALGFGTVATAGITDAAVTYAKMQDVSASSKLLGRGSAGGAGDVEEITVGSGLTMTGTTLSASGSSSGTYSAVLNSIMDYLAGNNGDPIDTKITSGDYIGLVFYKGTTGAGWTGATNATHTVTTGKTLVVLTVTGYQTLVLDPTGRRVRFQNTTDATTVVAEAMFAYTGTPYSGDSATASRLHTAAAGKTVRLETYSNDANKRAVGGWLIAKEV